MIGYSLYLEKKETLIQELKKNSHYGFEIKKKTASNLFRYLPKNNKNQASIFIKDFDNIIDIDKENNILEVEGLTTYENIVHYTLKYHLLPTVSPELKDITVGGAIVGIGIESTSYKYGFVHDGVIEADVLLPNGDIITCNEDNQYSDLFHALPNSYGTLGYILRVKIKLYRCKPYVHMNVTRFTDSQIFIDTMKKAIDDANNHFIEGLTFSNNEHYLMTSYFCEKNNKLDDIYRSNIFYKLIKIKKDIYLSTEDYIFRYDPDWFWNLPETFIYNVLRKVIPKKWRHSGFYKKYIDKKNSIFAKFRRVFPSIDIEEPLIQDWEVPWEKGNMLLQFALKNIDINNKPWAIIPIKPMHHATLYPIKMNALYFNLGCYCSSKRKNTLSDPFYNTKIMDNYCFSLGGLKMLYSSTFLSPEQFSNFYNGNACQQLKKKYDPQQIKNTLYEKIVCKDWK